jgi:outer membrane protein assembly factor BamB
VVRRAALLIAAALVVPDAAGAADVPTEAGSPWPTMRHDRRNTGRSPLAGRWRGDRPWAFRTGKGIFSTPVLGADGTVYVGSADTWFYALGPRGTLRWRLKTGGIIDAAAALGGNRVTVGSGDERLYHLRTDRRALPRGRRIAWTFRPSRRPATGQLVNWWEGNVALGFDGTIYAGSTGGAAYAITPAGRQRWAFATGNSVWTTPAFARDGTTYWGSVDLSAYAVDAGGRKRWSVRTLGFVTSSPALGADGTVYQASFDHVLYALDGRTGAVRWRFTTADHVYASPALGADGTVYITSADGSVYALRSDGRLRWRYDTGDTVRSSPVVGRGPQGRGEIVYVGSGDGRLYAIDAATGRRRWSYDTTPRDPALRDRNDLNGSPALGRRGVYVGGEHGFVWFVPYDWCRHAPDPRCDTGPGQPFGSTASRLLAVTPGGSTLPGSLGRRVPAATTLTARLLVRRGGTTVNAGLRRGVTLTTRPRFPFTARRSGDGRHLFVVPRGFLRPGTRYTVRVTGDYDVAGPELGAPRRPGGAAGGTLAFRTAPARAARPPLRVGRDRVSALRIRRLAIPLPPFVTSVNQIGFDSYDLIGGTLALSRPDRRGEGRVLMWVVTGRRDARGREVVDPRGRLAFPLAGRYRRDALVLGARRVGLTFSFGEVPLRRFELRGQLGSDGRMRPGASLYGEVTCADVPVYGGALRFIGLCDESGTLATSGTFLTGRYASAGGANVRPRGLRVPWLGLSRPTATRPGRLVARLVRRPGTRYDVRRHLLSLLLVDRRTGMPVAGDLRTARTTPTRRGAVVSLALPAGTAVPARVRAYVVADVFPLLVRVL